MLESPFIKVAGFAGSATLLKGDSNIGVFLRNMRNLFYRIPPVQLIKKSKVRKQSFVENNLLLYNWLIA